MVEVGVPNLAVELLLRRIDVDGPASVLSVNDLGRNDSKPAVA
jgi:hypothetical protein